MAYITPWLASGGGMIEAIARLFWQQYVDSQHVLDEAADIFENPVFGNEDLAHAQNRT
jgi:hypothetical protein